MKLIRFDSTADDFECGPVRIDREHGQRFGQERPFEGKPTLDLFGDRSGGTGHGYWLFKESSPSVPQSANELPVSYISIK